jgi:UDP-N-acetylglucosamine diphosphorylase/glucosamine-1-phosphate N-acetyltransferase
MNTFQPDSILLLEPNEPELLYPFTILHPVWELRCGVFRLFEKYQHQFPKAHILVHAAESRAAHLRSFCARFPAVKPFDVMPRGSSLLVVQANVLPTAHWWKRIAEAVETMNPQKPLIVAANGAAVAAYCPAAVLQRPSVTNHLLRDLNSAVYADAPVVSMETRMLRYLWDAIHANGDAIEDDGRFVERTPTHPALVTYGVFAVQAEQISLGNNVKIAPCVVLDASRGRIIIGNDVELMAQSTIVGPCSIGDHSLVKVGTRLYENTSLGEYCKVGGEIKNTIFQAFANKQHDGCLGYSFLGEWVNLGAGTNVSDLKNNYSRIRVRFGRTSPEIHTGQTSLGLLCGDHSKSGINSMFNTGTVVGVSANVFAGAQRGGYPEKYIPSFAWGTEGQVTNPAQRFDLEKAVALARTVMSRRKRSLTAEEEALLRAEYARGG